MTSNTDTASDNRERELNPQESHHEKKLEKVIQALPQEIQNEIRQMIRRDPRIARCLTEAQGREKEIIHAVKAGRLAGSTPVVTAEQGGNALKNIKKNIQNMFMIWRLRLRPPKPTIHPHDLPGVHPDFMSLAQGAYHNALVGVGHDHDEEDHHHGIEEHQPEVHAPAKEEDTSYYHSGHSAAIQAGQQKKSLHTH